ncbi:ARM repeat-containing protein [Lactarius akahatsu]|uniref:ARM repeat-containing protein n=1 Tax=Lactarius akahatsu TaxID=416441 RepID=A0AAD4LG10_9AGAM|nr:ARM repeat-containing protein [Lactarius akahatsu]
MAASLQPSTSPTDIHPTSDERKQSPPAFLDLADSILQTARLGSNMPEMSARVELKRLEHERQRALHRKMFEEQMRALEQQQAQELLGIPDGNGNGLQHMAASAPTTPPRVNALLPGGPDVSPTLRTGFARMGLDTDVLSRAVGSVSDKRKSVTYAPITRSPEIPPNHSHGNNGLGQGYGRAGAKSLPASRRTSASSHDEELAGHLQGLSMAGDAFPSVASQEQVPLQRNGITHDEDGLRYGNAYNAGMMLDEQLDEEMNNAILKLPTSDNDKFQTSHFQKLSASSAALDLAALSPAPSRTSVIGRVGDAQKPSEWPQFSESPRPDPFARDGRRVSTNPILSISDLSGNKLGGTVSASATPHLPSHGQVLTAHIQAPGSRRGSPLGLPDSMSITTRSVPATPLAGISNAMPTHLTKTPGTPISPEAQNLARLTPQGSHQLGDSPLSSDLQSSISRLSGHSQYDNFDSGYDDPLHPYGGDAAVYGLNNGNPIDDHRFNSYGNGNGLASTGSTALYHHHGSRYGLGIGGRVASDGKMNGLHGPKHRRGDVDREFNRFAGTRLEDLAGEISSLCKDQHGCRYLQKKLEEGVPEHRDMIFRETFGHFAELMTDPFGNYLCQKLLEYSTDEQRNIICESVAQDLVNISLNMHGTRAVQKMIDFLSTRRQTDHRYHGQIHSIIVALSLHVVVLIKDLNGNHVIQKCLNKLAPEDNQFIYNAVAANCVEVATHRHGCCVLQRCIDHASDHQRIQLVNEITYNALTLVQDPYGNYVVQYILDLNDNRFSDAVIRQFIGNVCALSVQKFSSNVIEKCIRVAEHNTRKLLIEELLNRTRLEKLLRDSYGNYCVQTALDYAEPGQRALLVDGIRPVLPLIRNTPYGKRIQNKLQREQQHLDHFGGYHSQQALAVNMANHGAGRHLQADPLSGVYSGQNGMYSAGLPSQGQPALSQAGLRGPIHSLQPHALDSYVLQSNAGHAPHQGAFSAFGNVGVGTSFPGVGVASSLADPYQRTSFGYSM